MFALCGAAGAAVLLLGLTMIVRAMLARDPVPTQTASTPQAAALAPATSAAVGGPATPVPAAPVAGIPPAASTTVPDLSELESAPSLAPPTSSTRPSVFDLGAGMYELTIPGGESLGEDERDSSAGITLAGGARLPSNVRGDEIRARIDEFRAGNTAELGDLTISWALIIKSKPSEPNPNKNPAATPISVNGLNGIEVRGPGNQLHWAFSFTDHSLMISARGPERRVHSAEVRNIFGSLRRKTGVPEGLALRAQRADSP
jgi:hypothetical protein